MRRSFWRRRTLIDRVFYLAVLCYILFVAACGGPPAPPIVVVRSPSPSATPTPLPVVTYHVSGAHILDNHGRVFIPYGVHLMGLFTADWTRALGADHRTFGEMVAARTIWHANTVALQLASANLFRAVPYDAAYLAKVDQEVTWAHQEGMNILLVLQYEGIVPQALPTQDSVRFWDFMSRHYRSNPWVFFDVFNEPVQPPGFTGDATWQIWQDGGRGYVGMQGLVNTIRGNGAQNLLFIDGLAAGEDLRGVPAHRIKGSNIVYAIHPYFGSQHQTKAQWDVGFGDVANMAKFPVVADEWNSYQSSTSECVPQAPALVPQLLSYLTARHIGLIAWALFPGLLIRQWDYANPTAYDQAVYTCKAPFPNYDPNAQGAGRMLLNFFATHSKPVYQIPGPNA